MVKRVKRAHPTYEEQLLKERREQARVEREKKRAVAEKAAKRKAKKAGGTP